LLYQLPNGKVIEISTEQFVEMTDEELEYLIAYNYGDVQENPWFGSVLSKQPNIDEIEPTISDLTQISDEDKLNFTDIDYDVDVDE
jgi:hypothetical protein